MSRSRDLLLTSPHYAEEHGKAWEAKSHGRPATALPHWWPIYKQWEKGDDIQMDVLELAAMLQQMAVCYRILWRPLKANTLFRMAIQIAAKDFRLRREIIMDWTAVLLDTCQPRKAVRELTAILAELDESDPAYAHVQLYLGRAIGRLFGRKNRREGLRLLSAGIRQLDERSQPEEIELGVDARIWRGEIYSLHDRRKHYEEALAFVREHCSERVKDVHITYVGGFWLRMLARVALAVMSR